MQENLLEKMLGLWLPQALLAEQNTVGGQNAFCAMEGAAVDKELKRQYLHQILIALNKEYSNIFTLHFYKSGDSREIDFSNKNGEN